MKLDIYKYHDLPKITPSQTISAIIPNYNYEDFIVERIDSILFQTYPVSELIILDDASSDNSVNVIEKKLDEVKTSHPTLKIKFLKNQVNSGGQVFSQWQKGIAAASGDYLWIAEADDSADPHFLETAMQKFSEHSNLVLFYCDSARIDQNNRLIAKNSHDWCDIWRENRWKTDYVNSGQSEIRDFLSANNVIVNVSSVVWKNDKHLPNILEEAKTYKIAGDWYIYSRILEYGDIAYSARPLNYYRKHNRGSVSTTINRALEYVEVTKIQDRITETYHLPAEKTYWQILRRHYMGFIENQQNTGQRGNIAWFVPDFPPGGAGGHRTIFQNINHLIDLGFRCDMYVSSPETPVNLYERIKSGYGAFKGDIYSGFHLVRDYDLIFATSWDTAEPVLKTNIRKKMYFIQDFEPWFFPMGTTYLKAENTYRYGFQGVSIGKWLTAKLTSEYDAHISNFDFCADLSTYHPLDSVEREKAICAIFQPFKPRRCEDIALKALQIVREKIPNLKIYLYGSAKRKIHFLDVEHLGVISSEECNALYNKCSVGLCMSSSNPSRIPFEMMAAGLPVVDLYRENNLYDLPDNGVLLAESSPEAIANAIIKLLESESLRKKMSRFGIQYMQDFPLERGFEQFGKVTESFISGKPIKNRRLRPIYTKAPITQSEETFHLSRGIKNDAYCDNLPTVTEIGQRGAKLIAKKAKSKAKAVAYKIYRRLK